MQWERGGMKKPDGGDAPGPPGELPRSLVPSYCSTRLSTCRARYSDVARRSWGVARACLRWWLEGGRRRRAGRQNQAGKQEVCTRDIQRMPWCSMEAVGAAVVVNGGGWGSSQAPRPRSPTSAVSEVPRAAQYDLLHYSGSLGQASLSHEVCCTSLCTPFRPF